MDIRNSKQQSVLLTPLFQELGRLARYTTGESPFLSPVALTGKRLYKKFKKGLLKSSHLTEIIKAVRQSRSVVGAIVHQLDAHMQDVTVCVSGEL
jgi:hypothetical protein